MWNILQFSKNLYTKGLALIGALKYLSLTIYQKFVQ